jgi:cell division protein FtsI/penicillin-binding protein 2
VLGYTDPTYGQSGLEASLDATLRGLQGYPAFTIWWSHLLDGQPPTGLDLRLSLDMDLQRLADQALGEHTGALVLLDAASGEVLAIASHPGFDANQIAADWDQIISDPASPLLDRATLGRYPAADLVAKLLPQGASARQPLPQVYLPDGGAPAAGEYSPLQVALLAAALSNGGLQPAPSLVQSVESPQGGWTPLPPLQDPHQMYSLEESETLSAALRSSGTGLWGVSTVDRQRPERPVSWYAGGALPESTGRRLALAVLLEEDDPHLAETIGVSVLQAASGR